MEYRLTLIDQPPDSPIEGCREFETWAETQEYLFFVVTRASRPWSAVAIEYWGPPVAGKWVLKGYASQAAIDRLIAEAADTEESVEQFRRRIWRVLQRGCAKTRKDWERRAMTRTGESLAPHLARAAAKGCGIRLSAKEVLRLQQSMEAISPSVSLLNWRQEHCCLCGLDYGERHEDGRLIPFESLCEDCAREVTNRRLEKRRQATLTARSKRQKGPE